MTLFATAVPHFDPFNLWADLILEASEPKAVLVANGPSQFSNLGPGSPYVKKLQIRKRFDELQKHPPLFNILNSAEFKYRWV
jgi:hypothetical protein